MNNALPRLSDGEILAARGGKNRVDPRRPYAFFLEPERTADGRVEPVATIFLTNRECPFRCLYCDLWKNTTDQTVPPGAIPEQIDYALRRLPAANHVKLYNSGNFFDARAIPPADHAAIAERLSRFRTVIVENHPRLCTESCLVLRDMLAGQLEIALGLETVHPRVLPLLNKRMTLHDFDRAACFLRQSGIAVRAFVLLRPPPLTEREGIDWAVRSLAHAFSVGAECCAVIPVRAGNGIMDRLQAEGRFAPPGLPSLEEVLDAGLNLRGGRVMVDLWEAESFPCCPSCRPLRIERLRQMNLSQQILPAVDCRQCRSHAGRNAQ